MARCSKHAAFPSTPTLPVFSPHFPNLTSQLQPQPASGTDGQEPTVMGGRTAPISPSPHLGQGSPSDSLLHFLFVARIGSVASPHHASLSVSPLLFGMCCFCAFCATFYSCFLLLGVAALSSPVSHLSSSFSLFGFAFFVKRQTLAGKRTGMTWWHGVAVLRQREGGRMGRKEEEERKRKEAEGRKEGEAGAGGEFPMPAVL